MAGTRIINRLALGRAPVINQEAAAHPGTTPQAKAAREAAEAQYQAQAAAIAKSIGSRAADEAVDVQAQLLNPVGAAFPAVTILNLVTFAVPIGCAVAIHKIAVEYSDPLIPHTDSMGWRLTVNAARVPNIFQQTQEFFFSNYGDVNNPLEISTVWVQASQTIALQLYVGQSFDHHVLVKGRLSGKLWRLATPDLTES